MRCAVALGCAVLLTADCSENRQADSRQAGQPPSATATATPSVAPGGTITGTVREQIPVDPYAYVRLETDQGEIWAAVLQAPLTVGSPVTVYNPLLMEQFASQTRNRTFAQIYFGSLTLVPGREPVSGTATDAPAPSAGPPPAEDAKVSRIARASNRDARTIGELWTRKRHLAGNSVSIRGVVVKYNPGVMVKNWIHLQDGSGDAARGTQDLAVTTLDEAAVGDTVTITGTVRTNRDVGAGYIDELIVEEANLSRTPATPR